MEKPKVSAKGVLGDIRSGKSDLELMRKYDLSSKGLQSLFNKLVKRGLLTAPELHQRSADLAGTVAIDPHDGGAPTAARDSEKKGDAQARPTAPKKKIPAPEVVADIRSGMADAELMDKYRISAKGLQSLFTKLVTGGYISQVELDARFRNPEHPGKASDSAGEVRSVPAQDRRSTPQTDDSIVNSQHRTAFFKKPGKGFLVWGVIILIMSVWPLFTDPLPPGTGIRVGDFELVRIVASASGPMQLLSICGGLISLGICLIFQRLSRNREKRMWILRILGLVSFVFASGYPFVGLSAFAQAQVMEMRGLSRLGGSTEEAFFTAVFALVLSAVSSVAAYLLIFRRKKGYSSIDPRRL